MGVLSFWDEQKVKSLVPEFPGVFDRAVDDWAKFKAGVEAGVFVGQQRDRVLEWYRDFPRLWETIRPNFIQTPSGLEWSGKVDDFIGRLKSNRLYGASQLGLVPIVVAGAIIAGGVAAALWAVGYIKKQYNLSEMIDQTVAGTISPEILSRAIEAEHAGGSMFGDIGNLVKWVLVGGAVLAALPLLGMRRK